MFEDFGFNIENMTVEDLKNETGWPIDTLATIGIVPYLSRMKTDIVGMIIGAGRGEDAYYVLESCWNLKKLYLAEDNISELAEKNLTVFKDRVKVIDTNFSKDIATNFVFFSTLETMNDIRSYYDRLQVGGIIAGVDHHVPDVKAKLSEFRNDNKVRIPIQVSRNNTWFWIKA